MAARRLDGLNIILYVSTASVRVFCLSHSLYFSLTVHVGYETVLVGIRPATTSRTSAEAAAIKGCPGYCF